MKSTYSAKIMNALCAFLKKEGFDFMRDDEVGQIDFPLCFEGEIKQLLFSARVRENDYVIYAYSPFGVPAEVKDFRPAGICPGYGVMTAEVMKFTCAANRAVISGSLELDTVSGVVRYRRYVFCGDAAPDDEVIRHSIFSAAAQSYRLMPGVADIIFCGASAEEALASCLADESDGEDSVSHERAHAESGRRGGRTEAESDLIRELDSLIDRMAAELGIDTSIPGLSDNCDSGDGDED